jgi:hypothetical protein
MDGVEASVNDYIEHHRARAARELEYFNRVLSSDEEAVSKAALAQLPSGKRHPHQYRVSRAALEESERVLLANLPALGQATSFHDLFELIDDLIRPIPGIGELTVYDTALKIGAHFGHVPTRVYIHAGTRHGVEALGLDGQRSTIEMTELPQPIQRLSAREAEDLLCIYKRSFGSSGTKNDRAKSKRAGELRVAKYGK